MSFETTPTLSTPSTTPTYTQLLETSWNVTKSQLGLVAGLSAVVMMGVAGLSSITYIGSVLGGLVSAGYIACLLRVRRGEAFDFDDFLWAVRSFNRCLHVVLATVLAGMILVIGFVLLIIPGIYVSVPLMFTTTILVMEDTDALKAIGRSFEMTRGHWWYLAGLSGVWLLLNVLGLLCFLVGIFVTFPISTLMMIFAVEALLGKTPAPSGFHPAPEASSSIPVNPN